MDTWKPNTASEVTALLSQLDGAELEPASGMVERTMSRLHADITSRDLIELFSSVFLLKLVVPLLGLAFGGECYIWEDVDE